MNAAGRDPARRLLLDIYRAALDAVDGARLVEEALRDLPLDGPVRLIAIGKAAGAMAEGAWRRLGTRIGRALVITPYGHPAPSAGLAADFITAGHPLPDANSLVAGRAACEFVAGSTPEAGLLVLISGGASALVEAPVDGLDLDHIRRANDWLLGSGLPIEATNAVRGALSTIKHGGLLRRLPRGVRVWQILLSDVPGDLPEVIGSGPFVPPGRNPLAGDWIARFPPWLRNQAGRTAEGGRPDPGVAPPVQTRLIAGATRARSAAAEAARARGVAAMLHPDLVRGDAAVAGERLATAIAARPGTVHVWSGETTVTLPAQPGRGGRCQSLALAAAHALERGAGGALLAAGTDGADGPGRAAGALVDARTVALARAKGFNPAEALASADAGSLLEATGDLVFTGPTGTNVMDLMLGWSGTCPAGTE